MSFPVGLVHKRILLCLNNAEHAIPVKMYMSKYNYSVAVATTVGSAVEMLKDEMPHAIFSEALLSDGTVAAIFDAVGEDNILKNVPVFVNIQSKSKEELLPCKDKPIAGFTLGKSDPQTLMSMIIRYDAENDMMSPFFHATSSFNSEPKGNQTFNVTGIGQTRDAVMFRSSRFISDHSEFKLNFASDLTAVISGCYSIGTGSGDYYHIFPTSRIKGPGRVEIMKLPDLALERTDQERLVIISQCDLSYFENLAPVLKGYNIKAIYAKTSADVWTAYCDEINLNPLCIFFDFASDKSSAQWAELVNGIDELDRPPTIMVTKSWNTNNYGKVRYISEPFGLGTLVSTIDSMMIEAKDLSLNIDQHGTLDQKLKSSISLTGIDELGGVFSTKMPHHVGDVLEINHPLMKFVNPHSEKIVVEACAAIANDVGRWYVRFGFSESRTSKYDHLSNVLEKIKIGLKNQTDLKSAV